MKNNPDTTSDTMQLSPKHWRRLIALLVCLILGTVSMVAAIRNLGRDGNEKVEEPLTYMSYSGPVLPLTGLSDTEDVDAVRCTEFDFSPYQTEAIVYQDEDGVSHSYDAYHSAALVTDQYTLRNGSEEDRTLSLLYPFAASLESDESRIPQLSVDGISQEVQLLIGPCSGGFSDVDMDVNLDALISWTDYQVLLEDGRYLQNTLEGFPTPDLTVTVYELSDRRAPVGTQSAENVLHMTIDPEKTTVLSYGFNAERYDFETGTISMGATVLPEDFLDDNTNAYLLFVGEEPENCTLAGYTDADWETENPQVTANLTRYEASLEEMVQILLEDFMAPRIAAAVEEDSSPLAFATVSEEQLYGIMAEYLLSSGVLTLEEVDYFEGHILEDLFAQAYASQRVMYLQFEVSLPAGGEVTVSAQMQKPASFDYIGEFENRNGYELVTQLGPTLHITEQTAVIENIADIVITGNSFGFEPEMDVDKVTLDSNVEQYWITVEKKE